MAKMNVRRGDQVKVISGNYRGQEGRVLRVDATKQPGGGGGGQPPQAPPQALGAQPRGRDRDLRGADPRLERDADRSLLG